MNKQKEKNGVLCVIIATVVGLAFLVAMVVVSVEINISDDAAFMREYKECRVADDLGMTYEDIEKVSKEMMDYLFDRREDLVVPTHMRGVDKNFFNDKERAHMVDVKNLLQGAILVRRICLCIVVIGVALIIYMKRKEAIKHLARGYLIGTGIAAALAVVIVTIIQINGFTFFWHLFHGVFFTNDLWLMDPTTDMIILLLPEKFFSDLIIHCVTLFAIVILVVFIAAIIAIVLDRKKRKTAENL